MLDEADLLVLAPYLESHWPGAGSGVGVGGQRQKGTDGLLEAEKPPDSKDVTCWSLWFTNFTSGVEVMSLKSRFLGPP